MDAGLRRHDDGGRGFGAFFTAVRAGMTVGRDNDKPPGLLPGYKKEKG